MWLFWFLLWIICGAWGASDASKRGKDGCLVFLLIFLLGPIGVIIWLLFRPEIHDY